MVFTGNLNGSPIKRYIIYLSKYQNSYRWVVEDGSTILGTSDGGILGLYKQVKQLGCKPMEFNTVSIHS
jgi:hypothetical protein